MKASPPSWFPPHKATTSWCHNYCYYHPMDSTKGVNDKQCNRFPRKTGITMASAQNLSLAMSKEKGKKFHIAMFPWLAFGHIIPFFQLAKFLAKKGHKITFLSAPKNIDRLPTISSSDDDCSIDLVKLPLPQVDGLPTNAEATMDINTDDMPYLKIAFDGLEPQLIRFLEKSKSLEAVDLIICDFAPHWLPQAVAKLGIASVFFSIYPAWFITFSGPYDVMIQGTDPRTKPEDYTVPPKWVPFENKVAYRIHEINWIMESASKPNASGVSDVYRLGMVIKGCKAIIVRHCREFEGQWLNLLVELHQRPVIPFGLLLPPTPTSSDGSNEEEAWITAKKWLDKQKKGSVVYVALGSEVALSEEQVIELALGLELSGLPFFWVLRKVPSTPGGSNDLTVDFMEGFEERVAKKGGMVWKRWAPQSKILSHESLGGFLTHCGWGSMIEALMFGLPLILLPFLVDQGLNARVMEDKQLGIEVARSPEDGSYTKHGVAECVRLVMVEKEGAKLRENAKEASTGVFGNRELQNRYLEEFNEKMCDLLS